MTNTTNEDAAERGWIDALPLFIFICSWILAAAAKLFGNFIWEILRHINPLGYPLYPGIWIIGVSGQIFLTCFLRYRRTRYFEMGALLLSGYWVCALLTAFTALFASHGLISSGK